MKSDCNTSKGKGKGKNKVKGKGKVHHRTGHEDTEVEKRYSSTVSLTLALDGVVVKATARPLYPWEKTRYPLYKSLGRPQGLSGRVRKVSPAPGFDPRNVQPVASRYTDWAIPVRSNRNRLSYCNTLLIPVQYECNCCSFELLTSEGGMLGSWMSTYKFAYVCLQALDNPWDWIWLFCLLLAYMTFAGQRGRLRSAELAVGGTNFLRVFASLHKLHLWKKELPRHFLSTYAIISVSTNSSTFVFLSINIV